MKTSFDGTKRCSGCYKTFPATSEFFSKDASRTDGFCSYCKTCHNARQEASRTKRAFKTAQRIAQLETWITTTLPAILKDQPDILRLLKPSIQAGLNLDLSSSNSLVADLWPSIYGDEAAQIKALGATEQQLRAMAINPPAQQH
jgi:hypothetical protein